MKNYSSREVIQELKKDGWYYFTTEGSHKHYKHPTKKGKVTVPHPRKDLGKGLLKMIEKQAGITLL
jgi:predicted RNA binding protein YcfA (HicA-like mRNA interferase family)